MSYQILLRYALLAMTIAFSISQSRQCKAQEPKKESIDLQHASKLFTKPRIVIVGEVHGTNEIPAAVAELVRHCVLNGMAVTLCAEIPASEQPRISRYLNGKGSNAERQQLVSGAHWFGQDGRSSQAMVRLIDEMRQLVAEDKPVDVRAIDYDPRMPRAAESGNSPSDANRRDQAMARSVLQAHKAKDGITIVLVGNVHSRVEKGLPWDADFLPMGWHLTQAFAETRSLNAIFAGGSAWVITAEGAGPKEMRGRSRGQQKHVQLFPDIIEGHHGVLYVGTITASAPAQKTLPAPDSDSVTDVGTSTNDN